MDLLFKDPKRTPPALFLRQDFNSGELKMQKQELWMETVVVTFRSRP
jgi:hypothetical protein